MSQLLVLNPKRRTSKKRRTVSGGRKRRSAAQVAATRKLVALNRGSRLRRNPTKRKSRRASPAASAPARRSRRSGRSVRRSFGAARAYGMTNVVPLLKSGAIGGAGAVVNDVLYAQAGRVLPASVMSPINADGSTNWLYFAGKAAMAVGVGILGRRVPVVGQHAGRMAEGALTVLSYQVMRGMLPASVQLAAYNPVPLMAPRRMNAYVPKRQLAAYVNNGAGTVTPMRTAAPARKLA